MTPAILVYQMLYLVQRGWLLEVSPTCYLALDTGRRRVRRVASHVASRRVATSGEGTALGSIFAIDQMDSFQRIKFVGTIH